MAQFKYTQLDKSEQLVKVKTRIADLERQHFEIKLRQDAPDLMQPPNETQANQLKTLEDSLESLHELEKSLS